MVRELDREKIAAAISHRRGRMTYAEVAEIIGTTEATMSRIINGRVEPSWRVMLAILAWMGRGYDLAPYLRNEER